MNLDSAARRSGTRLAWGVIVVLGLAHGWAIWLGLGGRAGIESGWPIWRDDHPLYYHSGLVTRHFLKANGTTAGYDPSFMAGYAKSVVFPASSTLPELVLAAFGGTRPELAYKVYVLISAAIIPWLVAGAGACWRLDAGAIAVAVSLFLIYVWTDVISYAMFGMLPYLLVIPLGLLATSSFCRYLDRGGAGWWSCSATLMVLVVFVHLTGAMIVAPAAAAAYGAALIFRERDRRRFGFSWHLGVWSIPLLVLACNAFWWLPGIWLASTKGPSDFAFAHPEGVLVRLRQVVLNESTIECVLVGLGVPGNWVFWRRGRVDGAALTGFIAAGFAWGYLAAGLRTLDFLQPGRHTYAFFSGLALASGFGVVEAVRRLERGSDDRFGRWMAIGLILIGVRLFGTDLERSLRYRLGRGGSAPFLTSLPSKRLLWLAEAIRRHVGRGERLLYEEGGFGVAGVADPFRSGRFSGLLPEKAGIELIGGPYLHAALKTNFTQFGEGKLFGRARWDREHFVRYARLYRPSAIACWTPWSRKFCRENPDLIEVREDDGTILLGRVLGFGGAASRGSAEVRAEAGRLIVRDPIAGPDGTVVLRYHAVPCLRASPPVRWEPIRLEDDPVPFIRIWPFQGTVEFELQFLPRRAPSVDSGTPARCIGEVLNLASSRLA